MPGPFKRTAEHSAKKRCPFCGHENAANALFCMECGSKLTQNPIPPTTEPIKRKKNSTLKKGILLVCSLVVVCVLAIPAVNKLTYQSTLDKGQAALVAGDFDSAVAQLNQAVSKQPKEAEAYRLLATAYVQKNDLYSAREIIKEGYATTKDDSLKEVSIWGPLSEFEIALMMSFTNCTFPFTRAEYIFDESSVTGNVHTTLQSMYSFGYLFDNVRKCVSSLYLISGENTSYGGGDFYILDPVIGYSLGYYLCTPEEIFDYYYDENMNKVSLSVPDNPHYTVGITKTSTNGSKTYFNVVNTAYGPSEQDGFSYSSFLIKFEYDSLFRISNISVNEKSYDFIYNDDGSFSVNGPFRDEDRNWKFNTDGCLISAYFRWHDYEDYEPLCLETTLNDSGKVKRIDITFPDVPSKQTKQYSYLDNGSLEMFTFDMADYSADEPSYSSNAIECTYDGNGNLIRIDYIDYSESNTSTYRTIEYDAQGRYASMTQVSTDGVHSEYNWESTYQYLENGALDTITVFESAATRTLQFFYDASGNLTHCKWN